MLLCANTTEFRSFYAFFFQNFPIAVVLAGSLSFSAAGSVAYDFGPKFETAGFSECKTMFQAADWLYAKHTKEFAHRCHKAMLQTNGKYIIWQVVPARFWVEMSMVNGVKCQVCRQSQLKIL